MENSTSPPSKRLSFLASPLCPQVIKAAKQSRSLSQFRELFFPLCCLLVLEQTLNKNLSGNFSGASFQFLYKNPNTGNILWGLRWNPLCPYRSRTMWGRWVSVTMPGLVATWTSDSVDATGKSSSNLRSSLLLPQQILFPVMFIFFLSCHCVPESGWSPITVGFESHCNCTVLEWPTGGQTDYFPLPHPECLRLKTQVPTVGF